MQISKTPLQGLLIFEPRTFGDDRGSFFESYNHKTFAEVTNNEYVFVQDNQSLSMKGTLRGLHFQNPPFCTRETCTRYSRRSVGCCC